MTLLMMIQVKQISLIQMEFYYCYWTRKESLNECKTKSLLCHINAILLNMDTTLTISFIKILKQCYGS